MLKTTLSLLVFGALLTGFYYNHEKMLTTISYSESHALEVLEYSKISYCDLESIYKFTCIPCQRVGMNDVTVFYNILYSAQAYMGYDYQKNRIVLAFRGTNDALNWINDMDKKKVPYPGCQDCLVHSGFYNTYNSIGANIIKQAQYMVSRYPTAQFYVTGHSLGAAVATIATGELFRNGINVSTFIHFASPRVGNSNFAKWWTATVKAEAIRVTHYRDPVIHLPTFNDGFEHVPNEVFYTNKESTQYKVCNGGEDESCSWDYIGWNKDDHTMYIRKSTDCN